mgnify:CR=1 FL=1
MKESIMSFFNAPITNKVPAGVCSIAGLHAYISSDPHLKELTQIVRSTTENDKDFRKKSKRYCLTSRLQASFRTVGSSASWCHLEPL